MSVYRTDESRVCTSSEDVEKAQNNGVPKTITTSPEASSTASDSPTPTNSVHEKNWSSHWQSLVCEEQRQLLGTEEESSDRQSDAEVEGDVWEMTSEQREYYRAQFSSLQPDPHGLLPGHVARAFFEKSRLPVSELCKIWQLSDVTKDGALSLEEFNTAMHLVVLRRNHIPVPDSLPPTLVPSSPSSSLRSTSPHRGKQWTKFVESPTSSVSSPGPKPINFDFHKSAVEQDPKILHPVALRVTPGPDAEETTSLTDTSPIRPIQRPQPKKHAAPGPGAIPPPPPQPVADETIVTSKKEAPPPPPPRPHRQHTRSSSLDLTRLGKSSGGLNMPPVVPPRSSPGTVSPKKQPTADKGEETGPDFANFAQFPEDQSKQTLSQGAFKVYRKPVTNPVESPVGFEATEDFLLFPMNLPLLVSEERREMHNAALRRHCHNLQYTLASLQEEKAILQSILDDLMCR